MINKKYIYKILKPFLLGAIGLVYFSTTAFSLESDYNVNQTDESCNLSVEVSINKIPACNQTDGSVSLKASGGTGNISYSWGESATRNDLGPGTYCIVVQDEAGCSALVDFTLKADNCPATCTNFTASVVIEKYPNCDAPNGKVSLSFLGANEPVAFSWGSEVSRSDLRAGNYSVTLVDAAGCTQVVDFELAEAPCKCQDFEASVVIEKLPKCDQADGVATIQVTGANGNLTYSWGNSNRRENLAPGGYWVTVTDEEGCSAVVDFELGKTACDCEFTAQAIIERNPSCTRNDGKVRLEFANAVGTVRHNLGSRDSYDNLPPGTYNVLVSDSICSVIVSFTMPEPDPEFCKSICDLSLSATIIKQSSCTLRDGSVCLEVTGATGDVTFSWGPRACYDNLPPGRYTVVATDDVCTDTITFVLDEPGPEVCPECTLNATAVVNQLPSCKENDGSVSLVVTGATGNVTYDWGPLSRYDNLSSGIYSVLITDDVCTYRVNFILPKPTGCPEICTLSASAFVKKHPSCSVADGMACIQVSGAKGPVSYDWGPENCRNNLSPGIYIVIVSDTVCSDTVSFTLVEEEDNCPCTLKGKISISKLPDCDNELASACIDVSGAVGNVSYSWGPDRCRNDLTSGSYSVVIKDESNCTDTLYFSIPNKPLDCCTLTAQVDEISHPDCEMQNGEVTITTNMAKGPVEFIWSDGTFGSGKRTGLAPGSYTVTVAEINSECDTTVSFDLIEKSCCFIASIDSLMQPTCENKDGSVKITITGAKDSITFIWSDIPESVSTRTNLDSGNYQVIIVEANTGCMDTLSFRLDKQVVSFTSEESEACDANGFIKINVVGGNEGHSFAWEDGNLESERTKLPNGNYTVTVTNVESKCTAIKSFRIDSEGPDITLVKNKQVCAGDTTTLQLINNDTTQELSFVWTTDPNLKILDPESASPKLISEAIGTPLMATVEVTNKANCKAMKSVSIQFRMIPDTLDPRFVFAANCKDTEITLKNESTNADLFKWNFGDTTTEADTSNDIKVTYLYPSPGTYNVTLELKNNIECSRDLNGLSLSKEIEVGAPIDLMANFDFDDNFPCTDEIDIVFTENSTVKEGSIDRFVWSYDKTVVENEPSISQTVTRGQPFELTLEIFDDTGLCKDSISDLIDLDPLSFVPVDIPACEGDSIRLIESIPDLPTDYVWQENDFFDTLEVDPIIVPIEEVDFVLISKVNNDCRTFEIDVITSPKVSYFESPDTTLCTESQTVSIGVIIDENVDLTWSTNLDFSPPLEVSNPFDASLGTYYFKLTNDNCNVMDSIIISPGMLDLTPFGDTLCEPGLANIGVINNNPSDTLNYEWQPPAENSWNIQVPVTGSTDFNVLVQNQLGCESTELIPVVVAETGFASNFTIQVNPEELAAGEIATLNVTPSLPDNYEIVWNPHPTLNTSTNPVEVTAEECTRYTADIIDRVTGCPDTISAVVNPGCISGNLFFPNAFSPNGDQRNDVLRVRGISGFEEMELIIFNRWGQKVFESTDPDRGWDGTFKGERVTSDVYGYHIVVKCPSRPPEVLQGNVTVLK